MRSISGLKYIALISLAVLLLLCGACKEGGGNTPSASVTALPENLKQTQGNGSPPEASPEHGTYPEVAESDKGLVSGLLRLSELKTGTIFAVEYYDEDTPLTFLSVYSASSNEHAVFKKSCLSSSDCFNPRVGRGISEAAVSYIFYQEFTYLKALFASVPEESLLDISEAEKVYYPVTFIGICKDGTVKLAEADEALPEAQAVLSRIYYLKEEYGL